MLTQSLVGVTRLVEEGRSYSGRRVHSPDQVVWLPICIIKPLEHQTDQGHAGSHNQMLGSRNRQATVYKWTWHCLSHYTAFDFQSDDQITSSKAFKQETSICRLWLVRCQHVSMFSFFPAHVSWIMSKVKNNYKDDKKWAVLDTLPGQGKYFSLLCSLFNKSAKLHQG